MNKYQGERRQKQKSTIAEEESWVNDKKK